MSEPNFLLLHVADVARSVEFYSALLGRGPAEASPGFAMFPLESGVMLGLWRRDGVAPAATAPGGFELGFAVADVDAVCADWVGRGWPLLQPVTAMDFGRTCVVADPDGHRLRAFTPA